MPDLRSDQPIVVTAEERVHLAIRKLARACIELARLAKRPASPAAGPANEERTHD